jgi:hypothetical protein
MATATRRNEQPPHRGTVVSWLSEVFEIPVFGAAGILSFLAPYRGIIALASIVLLAVTLLLRLRTARTCQLAPQTGPPSASPRWVRR